MKSNKAVSLIVLVITIVVLIILAGVAIANLSGNNSIVAKAQEGKAKSDEAKLNEETSIEEYKTKIETIAGGNNNKNKSIWEERGLDLSNVADKTYEFDTITCNGKSYYNAKVRVNNDGSFYLGRKFSTEDSSNDYNIIDNDTVEEAIQGGVGMAGENKISFMDYYFGYATIVFNGETATLYAGSTLEGTDLGSANSK